jgi:hypothetical protein
VATETPSRLCTGEQQGEAELEPSTCVALTLFVHIGTAWPHILQICGTNHSSLSCTNGIAYVATDVVRMLCSRATLIIGKVRLCRSNFPLRIQMICLLSFLQSSPAQTRHNRATHAHGVEWYKVAHLRFTLARQPNEQLKHHEGLDVCICCDFRGATSVAHGQMSTGVVPQQLRHCRLHKRKRSRGVVSRMSVASRSRYTS